MSCPDDKDSGRSQSEYGDLPFLLLEMEKNIVKTSQADGYLAPRIPDRPRASGAKAAYEGQKSGGGVARARAGVQNGFFLTTHLATLLYCRSSFS